MSGRFGSALIENARVASKGEQKPISTAGAAAAAAAVAATAAAAPAPAAAKKNKKIGNTQHVCIYIYTHGGGKRAICEHYWWHSRACTNAPGLCNAATHAFCMLCGVFFLSAVAGGSLALAERRQ